MQLQNNIDALNLLLILLLSGCSNHFSEVNHISFHELSLALAPDGKFTIHYAGRPWLAGGDVLLGNATSADGSLLLASAVRSKVGHDELGDHNTTSFDWALKSSPKSVAQSPKSPRNPRNPA